MLNLLLMLLVLFVVGIVVAAVAHGKTRFSLRTLLVAVTVVAVVLGLTSYFRSRPPELPPLDVGDFGTF